MTDWSREERLLATPLGQPGSGRVRYGAAMQFHRAGRISDGALEVYRICSADDNADPARLLAERGEVAPAAPAPRPAQAIRALLEACDGYLSELSGPGITEARQGLADWSRGDLRLDPRTTPVVDQYLGAAIGCCSEDHPTLANALSRAADHLTWITYDDYDPAEVGADFAPNHAFASLIGTEGLLDAPDFDFGLFLMAPHLLYRDHCHPAPELYVPLTGPHGWRFRPDGPLTLKPAHVPVWNEPDVAHMTKVGARPFLCLYAWTRDVHHPARIVPADDWADLETLHLTEDAA
jgi:hypothetical protein